ncbi:T9SS type A sorting domain-containing protein [Aureispira anguillae]|uniref:T9SS type A sorting domain-containing protein n=1 Tax=Aureispira anguillae TaxID=2864201 RepID=A0A915YH20_9BACT|nr:T9SS type A sorting domain-containing protein [Aureispira anguillae]BDS12938.1 T9SS type A sorting domain-containing protein [Aureispira anguillae]
MKQKKLLPLLFTALMLCLFSDANAQVQEDTTIVQTLTFDSITTRRSEWVFPSASEEYRKILMLYTLKCDPATTQDNYDCGEWDYLTYTYLYDDTGIYDSTKVETGHYYVNNAYKDTIDYLNSMTYYQQQWWDYFITYNTTVSETAYTVGTGTNNAAQPLGNNKKANKAQILWLASELTAAGMSAGNIDKLQLDVQQVGTTLKHLNIRAKHSSNTATSSFEDSGFSNLYHRNTTFPTTGLNTINLTTPFNWDGTSNILIEISFDNYDLVAATTILKATTTPANSVIYQTENDNYLDVQQGNYVETGLNDYAFGNEITVSFWSYGDPNVLPANTTILEGSDSLGNRIVNLHHPWSNGRIYWDQGTGSGTDRIDKAANASDYAGQWVHWAFTKNATSGVMNIYKDGVLWHTGVNKTRALGIINALRIGISRKGAGPFAWAGKVDELRIWNQEISQANIQGWMNKNLDGTHPDYANLVLYYNFDGSTNIIDQSPNGYDGMPSSSDMVLPHETIFKNTATSTERFNLNFIQGNYTSQIDSTLVTDTISNNAITIAEYKVAGRKFVIDNFTQAWAAGYTYTYDPMGNVIDSLMNTANNQILNDSLHYYEKPFEIVDRYEIGRYITPYGIGLSLGPNGFTWVFDVTDYAHLFHDSVEISAGNQQELIDLKFMMIKGTPPRDVIQVDRIWGQSRSYAYKNLDNNSSLPNKTINLHPNSSTYKVKTRITGHGHNSTNGNYPHCCEWKDNTHYFHVNNNQVDSWHIWQTNDCALNPVYPQGGTWPGSREGWCPGDIVKEHEIEITPYVSGNTVDLDYSITPVPANNLGMGNGNYVMGMHLVQYGPINHSLDAEIYEVLSPTDYEYRSRTNPLCRDLQIVIRNNGSTPLTSLTITYNVVGGQAETFNWTGNLDFGEMETVTLPVPSLSFWVGNGSQHFTATVSNPNGGTDEYPANDYIKSHFEVPTNYLSGIKLEFKTNNRASENSYTITNESGTVMLSRSNMTNNTTYRDTLNYPPGCYTLEVLDSGNDGLSYWANTAAGGGFCRFLGSFLPFPVKTFEPEFGRRLTYSFSIDMGVSTEDIPQETAYSKVFPNPNDGTFTIELMGYQTEVSLSLYNVVGKLVEQRIVSNPFNTVEQFNIKKMPAGVYLMKVVSDEKETTHKIIVE